MKTTRHSPRSRLLPATIAACALLAAGCPDPTEGKPKADVKDAPAAAQPAAEAPPPRAPAGAITFDGESAKVEFVGA